MASDARIEFGSTLPSAALHRARAKPAAPANATRQESTPRRRSVRVAVRAEIQRSGERDGATLAALLAFRVEFSEDRRVFRGDLRTTLTGLEHASNEGR